MTNNALTAFYYLRAKRQKREDRRAYIAIIITLALLGLQIVRGA
jgi:heme A synthase